LLITAVVDGCVIDLSDEAGILVTENAVSDDAVTVATVAINDLMNDGRPLVPVLLALLDGFCGRSPSLCGFGALGALSLFKLTAL
jgi:hypothetical protein